MCGRSCRRYNQEGEELPADSMGACLRLLLEALKERRSLVSVVPHRADKSPNGPGCL